MADYLPPGSQVDGFEIRRVVADDQESVDYEAWDSSQQRTVRVREFLPDDFVERLDGATVTVGPTVDQGRFDAELGRFLAQHQRLQLIDHPAVLNVLQCVRANGTGYVVMDAPPGETLAEVLEQREVLSPSELADLWPPLLNGLEAVHHANLLHGGITPEHILLPPGAGPILWGFQVGQAAAGSPRQAFGSALPRRTEAPTAGYAALEQYSARGHEGRWTDIYSLGAVLYRCMTGEAPPDAPGRAIEDDLIPAERAAQGQHEERLLAAVDAALAMRVIDRPQTVAAWRELMAAPDETRPAPSGPRGRIAARGAPRRREGRESREERERGPKRPNWTVPAVAAIGFIAVLTYVDTGILRSPDEESAAQEPVAVSDPQDVAAADAVQLAATPESAAADFRPLAEPAPESGIDSRSAPEPSVASDAPVEQSLEARDSRLADAQPELPNEAQEVAAAGDLAQSVDSWAEPLPAFDEASRPVSESDEPAETFAAPIVEAGDSRLSDAPTRMPAEAQEAVAAEDLAQSGEFAGDAASESEAEIAEAAADDGQAEPRPEPADVADATAPAASASAAPPSAEPELAEAEAAPVDEPPVPPPPAVDPASEALASVPQESSSAEESAAVAQLAPFTVVSDPAGATIRFADGGRPYRPGMMMRQDSYRLIAEMPGYEAWQGDLIHNAATDSHSVTLKPLVASSFSDALRSGGTGPMMVRIEPGAFTLGCVSGIRCFSNELPVLDVAVDAAYAISKHEITVGDYAKFLEATDYAPVPAAAAGGASLPAVNVSWADAVAYADWLASESGRRYRLPTETEWEYAARAGTGTAYSWGDEVIGQRSACTGCGPSDAVSGAVPVGSFEANAWGVHDMHGNVWEWVLDCGEQPRQILQPGLEHKRLGDCRHRVRRGGSWDNSARRVRSASRDITGESLRSPNTGFRVMLLNP